MNLKLLFLNIKRRIIIIATDWILFIKYELKQPFIEVKTFMDLFTKTINKPTTLIIVSVLLFLYSVIVNNIIAQKISFLILLFSFIYKEKISGAYKGEYKQKYFSK